MNRFKYIVISAALAAALAVAHGGFEHVQGTVSKADASVLTVKTARGDVSVKLNGKTEITKDGKAALPADLKPGLRVVVDIPEDDKTMTAHSVKIGVAEPSAAKK